jgi:hypothetical protein
MIKQSARRLKEEGKQKKGNVVEFRIRHRKTVFLRWIVYRIRHRKIVFLRWIVYQLFEFGDDFKMKKFELQTCRSRRKE